MSVTLAHVRSAEPLEVAGVALADHIHVFAITAPWADGPIWHIGFSMTSVQAALPQVVGNHDARLVAVHPRYCQCSGPDVPPSLGLPPELRRELLSMTATGRATLAEEDGHARYSSMR